MALIVCGVFALIVIGFAIFVLPELKDMMDSMGGDDFPPGAAAT